jgi:hypothetical protein
MASCCEHSNNALDFMKGGKFLGQLNYYHHLTKDFAP